MFPWRQTHLKLFGAGHMRDVRGTVARGVDQIAAAHIAGRRHQRKARSTVGSLAASNFNGFHRRGAHKRHAVGHGVLQRRDGHFKRVDVTGRRAPQRACCVGAGTRFQLVDTVGANDRQLGHAVGQAILA